MKVLYVNHTSTMSGAELALLDTLDTLPDGVQAVVACPPGPLKLAVEARGLGTLAISGTAGSLRLHPTRTPRAVADLVRSGLQIRGLAHRTRPDLVHANSLRAGLACVIGRVFGGPPVVVHAHDRLPAGKASSLVLWCIVRGSRLVVAISRYTAEPFERLGATITILHNPIQLSRLDPDRLTREEARTAIAWSGTGPLLVVVGQITPWKGQADAIRAMARVRSAEPEAELLIVGAPTFVDEATRFDNNAYHRQLHTTVEEEGLQGAVRFLGHRHDVAEIMRSADMVLVPSHEEPFGRVVVEAMAMQTLVLATEVGGPREFIEDGFNGRLLPPRRPDLWADTIIAAWHADDERQRIAEQGRETVISRFDAFAYSARLVRAYASMLDADARRPSFRTQRSLALLEPEPPPMPQLTRVLPARLIRWLGRLQFKSPILRWLANRASKRITTGDTTIRRGPGAGLRINAAHTFPGYVLGTTEPDVQRELMALCTPGAVVYDVGANVGFFTLLAARAVGPSGRVIAMDPVPHNVAALRHNAALNGFECIEVLDLALTDAPGAFDMAVGVNTTQSQLGAHATENVLFSEQIMVQGESGDALVASGRIPPPDLIKMDIEGAEVEALVGLATTLRSKRPLLLVEMHGRNREVSRLLDEAGYDVRVLGEAAGGRLEDAHWAVHIVATPR